MVQIIVRTTRSQILYNTIFGFKDKFSYFQQFELKTKDMFPSQSAVKLRLDCRFSSDTDSDHVGLVAHQGSHIRCQVNYPHT